MAKAAEPSSSGAFDFSMAAPLYLNSITDQVFLLDTKLIVQFTNKAALEFSAAQTMAIVGESAKNLWFNKEHAASLHDFFDKVVKEKKLVEHFAQDDKYWQLDSTLYTNEQNEILGILQIVQFFNQCHNLLAFIAHAIDVHIA